MQHLEVGSPMERVALDLLGPLPETEVENRWILVVGDYFTKWMEAYPLRDAKAETVAKTLVTEFVCRFGVPAELHSDQGRNFEAEVFAEVCRILGIHKTRTTPYNPKSDGLIERFNRTLINMVATMIDPHKRQKDWDLQLPFATFAYRSTPQESTGETPNMLMFGRETRMPIELTTATTTRDLSEGGDYADEMRSRMQDAHERARIRMRISSRRQKKGYDRKSHGESLRRGDFVWLHNPAKRKGVSPKLESKWEGPYLILNKLSDVVFQIQRNKRGKKTVVHYDRLKRYEGEPIEIWTDEERVVAPPSPRSPEQVVASPSPHEERVVAPPPRDRERVVNPSGDLNRERPRVTGRRPSRRQPYRRRRLPERYRLEL